MLDISTPVPNIKDFPPAMNKIVVQVNLRENSEGFNSEFFVLSTVRSGKLGAGKPRNLINVLQRKLQGFHSEFSCLGTVRNGKLGVGKPPNLINVLQRKLLRFSTPGFRYSAKWKTPSAKTDHLTFPSRPRRFDK